MAKKQRDSEEPKTEEPKTEEPKKAAEGYSTKKGNAPWN